MKPISSSLLIAAAAFSAGVGVARLPQIARATTMVEPRVVDVTAMTPDDYPSAAPALPGIRQKVLASTDGMAISAQYITSAAKHTHASSNEFQIILAGTGTEYIGDSAMPIKPGSFVEVPIGTTHAGLTGGPFTIVSIKAPAPVPGDYHAVP